MLPENGTGVTWRNGNNNSHHIFLDQPASLCFTYSVTNPTLAGIIWLNNIFRQQLLIFLSQSYCWVCFFLLVVVSQPARPSCFLRLFLVANVCCCTLHINVAALCNKCCALPLLNYVGMFNIQIVIACWKIAITAKHQQQQPSNSAKYWKS